MEETRKTALFRSQAKEKVSSPEQLSDYLRVTDVGVWAALAVIVLLLTGLFVWASVGRLETDASAKIVVEDGTAQIVLPGGETAGVGMVLRVAGQEVLITDTESDDFGRSVYFAELSLPDGAYDGTVVVDTRRPIEFLFSS